LNDPSVELSCAREVKVFKEKWYKNNWVILFFTFIVPPLGIYLMLKHQNTWSYKYKSALSAVSLTLFLGCILCGLSPSPPKIVPIPSLNFSAKNKNREKVNPKKGKDQTVKRIGVNSIKRPKKRLKSRIRSAQKLKMRLKSFRSNEKTEKSKGQNKESFNEIKPVKDNISSSSLNSADEPIVGKGTTVYITDKGKCYHFKKCRRGSNYHAVTLEEAEEKGLKPCKKCTKQS